MPRPGRRFPQERLVRAAIQAANSSYSPYSRFSVGAALLTDQGDLVTGCNVENASYGLTVCAERVALFKAVSEGHRAFEALAVAGGRGEPVPPCGACLQVLAEFCGPEFPVILVALDSGAVPVSCRLKDLLPRAFHLRKP